MTEKLGFPTYIRIGHFAGKLQLLNASRKLALMNQDFLFFISWVGLQCIDRLFFLVILYFSTPIKRKKTHLVSLVGHFQRKHLNSFYPFKNSNNEFHLFDP